MKNNYYKTNILFKKTFRSFLIKLGILTVIFPVIFSIINSIVSKLDFQWLYEYSRDYYYDVIKLYDFLFEEHGLYLIIPIIWLIGVIILVYREFKKFSSYINDISLAFDGLLNKEIEYVELPIDLEEIQNRINYLKNESQKNEILARESEQRKNDLIVYLAHDLKTPLTSIIGYLSLIDEIKDMPKKQREKYVKVALDKSYRVEELINELFDIARFNSESIVLEKEELNLNMMLEQIIDDFYPILNENNKEIKLMSEEKVLINGDSDKLARVFGNIIKNAIYYSTDNLITMEIKRVDDYACVTTSNKGKKIPEEKLKKLFDKFYRADSSRTTKTGGSGLGLAIAKEIVELHNGKIRVANEGDYIKFYVELPIIKNQ